MNPFKTTLSNGATVHLEITELGNRYITDEVGGGALVWDTAIVSKEAMLAALAMELGVKDKWLTLIEPCSNPEKINQQRILYYLISIKLASENAKLMADTLPEHLIRKYSADIKADMDKSGASTKTGRRPVPGFRFFACEEEDCLHAWGERTRDCLSPSGEPCPKCGVHTPPATNEGHPEWPRDTAGNLK